MGYNSTTGIISAPIGIADVQQVLGDASNDLATLCTSSKINKWAKYSPVSASGFLSESEVASKKFKISGSTIILNTPTGGAISPYRLGDFREYDSTTSAPYVSINCMRTTGETTTTIIGGVTCDEVSYDLSLLFPYWSFAIKVDNNYILPLETEDGVEYYGSSVVTWSLGSSFSYVTGIVSKSATGAIGSFYQIAIDNWGVGQKDIEIQNPTNTPSYVSFAQGFNVDITNVTTSAAAATTETTRINITFRCLDYASVSNRSGYVYYSVRKISDNSVLIDETYAKTHTLALNNTITFDIPIKYVSVDLAFFISLEP